MKNNEVGHVQSLNRIDECECDERGCDSVALYRLTVPCETSLNGTTFRDFCRDCYRDYQHEHSKQRTT